MTSKFRKVASVAATGIVLAGCATTASTEKGPDGTIAYHVEIESSEPGARIEANEDYIGKTPVTLKIFGDPDGSFHNFGSQDYVIRAYPVKTNQFMQTRIFRTGGWFSQEDSIPKRLYFDLNEKSETFTIEKPRY